MSTTQTLLHGIEQGIFKESERIAKEVLRHSGEIRNNYRVEDLVSGLYAQRRDFISELVGSTGRYTFTPRSMYDATEEANELISKETMEIERLYNLTPLGSDEGNDYEVKYRVLNILREKMTSADYLANTVPQIVKDRTKDETVDGKEFMASPKLSRWITKLVGESSELTKWYTNSCPKGEDVVGERTDFNLVLSVLPHDIVGMSYYAPLNFDGDRWVEGYHGTSCMDTIQNGDGSSMHQLPLNLSDETMMVAYLVKLDEKKSDDLEDLEDVFYARMLVRVVEVNGKHILIGQRIYATSRGSSKLITEAMKVEFGSSYIHCNELDDMGGSYKHYTYTFERTTTPPPTKDCRNCDGTGRDSWDDDCGNCEGSGQISKYEPPYNDNGSVLTLGIGYVKFHLPKSFIETIE